MLKNGTPASPATARARSVLPVPGDPIRRTPLGIFAPSASNRSGNFRNSTTSASSAFASSTPATSANVTGVLFATNIFALLLPKLIAWLFWPCALRIMKMKSPPINSTGRKALISRLKSCPESSGAFAPNVMLSALCPPAEAAVSRSL